MYRFGFAKLWFGQCRWWLHALKPLIAIVSDNVNTECDVILGSGRCRFERYVTLGAPRHKGQWDAR